MLYQFNELRKVALAPLRSAAQFQQQLLRSPLNPIADSPPSRMLAAACEWFEETTAHHSKPPFAITQVAVNGQVAKIEEEIHCRKPFCQLKHFNKDLQLDQPKLLLVAPLSGHFASLLRGTVKGLLADNDVYITDWRDSRDIPLTEGIFDLDDYIDYIREYLHYLGPNTHVVAVCQPGVPVMAAVALMAEAGDPATPMSMTLIGSPIDTRRHMTVPARFAKDHPIAWFEHVAIHRVSPIYAGAMRRVYPGFMQLGGFICMNLDEHLKAYIQQFDNLVKGDGDSAEKHREFYAEYKSTMDVPADYYLQTLETVFHRHALPDGTLKYRNEHLVNTAAIENTALFTIEGELDDISGVGQTVAAHDICPYLDESLRGHYVQKGIGHYGAFNGSKYHKFIAPRIVEFIAQADKRRD